MFLLKILARTIRGNIGPLKERKSSVLSIQDYIQRPEVYTHTYLLETWILSKLRV